jgi:hypothetical protein
MKNTQKRRVNLRISNSNNRPILTQQFNLITQEVIQEIVKFHRQNPNHPWSIQRIKHQVPRCYVLIPPRITVQQFPLLIIIRGMSSKRTNFNKLRKKHSTTSSPKISIIDTNDQLKI